MPLPPDPQDDEVRPPGAGDEAAGEPGADGPAGLGSGPPEDAPAVQRDAGGPEGPPGIGRGDDGPAGGAAGAAPGDPEPDPAVDGDAAGGEDIGVGVDGPLRVGFGVDLGPIKQPPPAAEEAPVRQRPPRSPAYNTPTSAAYARARVPATFAPGTSGLAAATTAAGTSRAAGTTTVATTTAVARTTTVSGTGTAGDKGLGRGEGDAATTVLGPRHDHSRLRWTLAAVVALVVGAGLAVAISGGGSDGAGTGTGTGAAATRTTAAADAVAGGAPNSPGSDGGGIGAPATAPPPTTGPAHGPGSPVAAMEDYLDAIRKRDCRTMVSMVTVASLPAGPDPRAAALDACREDFATGSSGLNAATFANVRLVSQTSDRAIVTFDQTVGGTSTAQTTVLHRRNGRWLLVLNR